MTNRSVFHVVCRDCRTESVVNGRADAERLVADHAATVGHRVEFVRVA
ncbi:hypothetical protein ACFQE1_13075 [Halobium palmae]|uniref:DUF1059 domain-containing protein n=1 Tax=Halobium palmae TaxID=1776492 RepID=A0ABD5S102_9EURY